jgi:PE family
MSGLSITPDGMAGASGELADLGAVLRGASTAAASQTTAIVAPAADEVSAAVTSLFGTHAQEFQAVSARAAAFHDNFVNLLNGSAAQYFGTELANAQQTLTNAVNAPAQALLGHPLIGAETAGVGSSHTADSTDDPMPTNPMGPLSENLNYPFGPFLVSLNQTGIPLQNGLFGISSGTVSLNTSLGSTVVLAESGTEYVTFDGPFALSLLEYTPFYSVGASMTGTLMPQIQISGLSYSINGLALSWPGTYLGGFIPDVGQWAPIPIPVAPQQ